MGVLSCFGGGAARRVGKSQFEMSLRVAAPPPKKYPDKRIPPATHANKKLEGKEHRENIKRRAVRGVLCII